MAVILALRFISDIRKTTVSLTSIYCVHHHSVIPSLIHKPSFMNDKIRRIAIVLMVFALFYPQKLAAQSEQQDIFKASDFLTWEKDGQEFYIRTSIGMASLIVGQSNDSHRRCIEDWYYADETASNNHIRSTMSQYSEYHPRGILLSILEKKCGRFIYGK